jgi:hypothetical protein
MPATQSRNRSGVGFVLKEKKRKREERKMLGCGKLL